MTASVLTERLWQAEGAAVWVKRAALVALGVAVLALAAKIKFPLPPSPVPVTLGTFAVLSIGAAYGPRLGLVTILAYMAVGAFGYDVFANSSADKNGIAYMMGTTGGYLLGYVLATLALGWAARQGWDRSVLRMALAMLIGNALIYVPGVAWLYVLVDGGLFDAAKFASAWQQTLTWGFTPYLIGDGLKLLAAAVIFPLAWKLVGNARA
jgi:biotin transport system substrate-specific component